MPPKQPISVANCRYSEHFNSLLAPKCPRLIEFSPCVPILFSRDPNHSEYIAIINCKHIINFCLLIGAGFSLSVQAHDENNTIAVFKNANPSVVTVTNQTLVRDRRSFDLLTVPQGAGTGFVWNREGIIVTNFHVLEGARKITITLPDQSHWPAEIIGLAPDKDLAVLRIKAPRDKLKPLPLGDSSQLEVGRSVLAIGNPFGLDATLTVGVVSALGREIESPNNRKIRNVIQTDAAINPGNSGGPLLNSKGQLIGVNTMLFSPSGANAGIGFAIPVNTVKKIVPQLIQHGRLVRPILGIDVAPQKWASNNKIIGVPVLRSIPGLPAAQAGIQGVRRNHRGGLELGDIIIGINGHKVHNYDDLLTILEQYRAGDQVELELQKRQERRQQKLILAAPR